MSRRATMTALLALVALMLPAGAASAKAPSPKKEVRKAFAGLILETRTVPKRFVSKRNRARLVGIARRARRQSTRRPCKSLKTLRRYKRGLRRVHVRRQRGRQTESSSPRGRLRARILTVNAALMQLPRSKRCGGGKQSK